MITLTKLMESVTPLKESLLGKTKDKVENAGKSISTSLNIPTLNDFYKCPYDPRHIEVDWDCEVLLDMYRSQFPDLLAKEGCKLKFQIDQTWRQCQTLNIYIVHKNTKNNWFLRGWVHHFVGANLRVYKKEILKLIDELAHDLDKFERLLQHGNDMFRKASYYEKDLLKDL